MLNIDDRLIKEVSPKIGPNALSVLLAIAIHINQKSNRCFPSHHRIMELTGIGKNAVYDALNVLKKEGILSVEQKVDSKKKQFGQRVFRLSTRFISIFVAACDVDPLPESREPEIREPESREPEIRETQQINESEQINEIEQIKKVEQLTPVSEKSTVALTTFSPGEKIQNLEVIVVEGVEISLDADLEQTCSGGGGETQQCSTYDLYAALEAKKDKPVRDHDSQILQDFSNLGTQADFEETKRRMTNKANNVDAAEIITYLNTATGSQFRTAAKTNVALVNARMKEGATGDDMKLIIDHKNEQWGTDAKMREHLCPETLFRAGHYEKYINAARKWQQDKSGPVADRYAMNDAPKAQTPEEMVREMSFFYRTHIHDGDDGRGLLSAAQKHAQTAYGPDRLNEVVRAFCSHRIGKGLARETFEQQHGALCLWLQNEKKREQRGQGGPAVFNPSDIRAQQRRANVED